MLELPPNHQQILNALAAFCHPQGVTAWLVGGYTRDLLLGRPGSDIDVAVTGDGYALARAYADATGGAFVALDEERATGRVVLPAPPEASERPVLDIARLRGATIEDDLRARDFTINALALPLNRAGAPGTLVDPCGGQADLTARVLRACSDHALRNDPLRLLRAIRQAAQLGFAISPELDALLRRDAPLLTQPAAERVRDELIKLLNYPTSTAWLRYMDDTRLLTTIFPELEPARTTDQPNVHFLPVLAHSLETVAAVEWILAQLYTQDAPTLPAGAAQLPFAQMPVALQTYPQLTLPLRHQNELRAHFAATVSGQPHQALFKLAALLHDNAKPQTKRIKPEGGVSFYDHQTIGAEIAESIAQRLRFSRGAVQYICGVVRAHMRPGQLGSQEEGVTIRAALRLFRDTGGTLASGEPYGPDVLLHAMADHLATRGPLVEPAGWDTHVEWTSTLLDLFWAQQASPPPVLLDGHTLMRELEIQPGPQLGELLNEIREAQAAGEVETLEQALALARRIIARAT